MRPREHIQFDLDTALWYRRAWADRPTDNPWVLQMRAANEREIAVLEAQLAAVSPPREEQQTDG